MDVGAIPVAGQGVTSEVKDPLKQQIFERLRKDRLSQLDLRGVALSQGECTELGQIFSTVKITNLTKLRLDGQSTLPKADFPFATLRFIQSLRILKVESMARIDLMALFCFSASGERAQPTVGVEKLKLHNIKEVTIQGGSMTSKVFSTMFGAGSSIRKFEFCGCMFANEDRLGSFNLAEIFTAELGSGLKSNNRLTSLNFSNNRISPKMLEKLIECFLNNQTVKKLHLNKCALNDDDVRPLIKLVKRSKGLTHLSLSNNSLTKKSMASLSNALASNASLEVLDVSSNDIDNEGIFSLLACLRNHSSIRELYVGSSRRATTTVDNVSLASAFRQVVSSGSLKVLDLQGCSFLNSKILYYFLSNNCCLDELWLGHNEFPGPDRVTFDFSVDYTRPLPKPTFVRRLHLRRVSDLSDHWEKLLDYIRSNPVLELLDLSDNQLGNEKLKALCEALAVNNSISHLNLSKNMISDCSELLLLIKKVDKLSVLKLKNNLINKNVLKLFQLKNLPDVARRYSMSLNSHGILANYIKTNAPSPYPQKLNLRGNLIDDLFIACIAEILKHNLLKKVSLTETGTGAFETVQKLLKYKKLEEHTLPEPELQSPPSQLTNETGSEGLASVLSNREQLLDELVAENDTPLSWQSLCPVEGTSGQEKTPSQDVSKSISSAKYGDQVSIELIKWLQRLIQRLEEHDHRLDFLEGKTAELQKIIDSTQDHMELRSTLLKQDPKLELFYVGVVDRLTSLAIGLHALRSQLVARKLGWKDHAAHTALTVVGLMAEALMKGVAVGAAVTGVGATVAAVGPMITRSILVIGSLCYDQIRSSQKAKEFARGVGQFRWGMLTIDQLLHSMALAVTFCYQEQVLLCTEKGVEQLSAAFSDHFSYIIRKYTLKVGEGTVPMSMGSYIPSVLAVGNEVSWADLFKSRKVETTLSGLSGRAIQWNADLPEGLKERAQFKMRVKEMFDKAGIFIEATGTYESCDPILSQDLKVPLLRNAPTRAWKVGYLHFRTVDDAKAFKGSLEKVHPKEHHWHQDNPRHGPPSPAGPSQPQEAERKTEDRSATPLTKPRSNTGPTQPPPLQRTQTDVSALEFQLRRQREINEATQTLLIPVLEALRSDLKRGQQHGFSNTLSSLEHFFDMSSPGGEISRGVVGPQQTRSSHKVEENPNNFVVHLKQPGHKQTKGDGNCAFNAAAIGICALALKGTLKKESSPGMPLLLDRLGIHSDLGFLDWIKKQTFDEAQVKLSPILRQLVVERIVKEQDVFVKLYEEELVALFNALQKDPKAGDADDTFYVHSFIREKLQEVRLDKEDLKALEEKLRVWWRASGVTTYLTTLKKSARYHGDRERYGSHVELSVLAYLFEVNINFTKQGCNNPIPLGIGAGCLEKLSPADCIILRNLNVCQADLGVYRLCLPGKQALQDRIDPLPGAVIEIVIAQATTAKEKRTRVFDLRCLSTLLINQEFMKLELLGRSVIQKQGSEYWFTADTGDNIDLEALRSRMQGITDPNLKTLVLTNYRTNVPEFTVRHMGAHWEFVQ